MSEATEAVGLVEGASGQPTANGTAAGGGEDIEARVSAGIRQAILAGEYAPGQRLIEAELCAEFGASRSIVRVALQVLVSEGLVEIQRHKGARVRVISLPEALEIVEVRMMLEALAAARAAQLATPEDDAELRDMLAGMRKAVETTDLLVWRDLNERFHASIQRISGNGTCTRMLERLRGQVVRHQFQVSLQPGRLVVSLDEHEKIANAIYARDPEAAETAMREHLSTVGEKLAALRPTRYP
ncbi:MAG: GntR family transcriptional regulator [Acidimicrobiaceae bacterium]|nr:GntR family transcriptional regulator [Acidimicrobiaceae bacterium]